MTRDEATALIRPAVAGRTGDLADLGAGKGTFTAALGACAVVSERTSLYQGTQYCAVLRV